MSEDTISAFEPQLDGALGADLADPFAPAEPVRKEVPTGLDADTRVLNAATSTEASVVFEPSAALISAVNDAKILWLSFHSTAPDNMHAYTWCITHTTRPRCEGHACPMVLCGRLAHKPFATTIIATPEGMWKTESGNTYPSLDALLKKEVGTMIQKGRHKDIPLVESWDWIPSEHDSKDLEARNMAIHDEYRIETLGLPAPGKAFAITHVPFPQTHIVIMTLTTRDEGEGVAEYVLGYHPKTKMWFLTDPRADWARVALSLEALLGTLAA